MMMTTSIYLRRKTSKFGSVPMAPACNAVLRQFSLVTRRMFAALCLLTTTLSVEGGKLFFRGKRAEGGGGGYSSYFILVHRLRV